MPRDKLLVFLKAPRRSTVKTRLAAELGADDALAAYLELASVTLSNLAALAPVELRFTPDDAGSEIAPWLQAGWSSAPQGNGDLGARLARSFGDAFRAGHERVVVIGSDCPYLTGDDIRTAWEGLAENDVVIGPATDGGYWLLGLRSAQPDLFEGIDWSTASVLSQTLQRAEAAQLSVTLLRELSDVDTATDWQTWRKQ